MMGTQKRKPMMLLGPAQGKTLVLNLCVGMVVKGRFTADMELGAFICGENSNLLVIVAVGFRHNCISETKHENVAFLFNILSLI